MNCKRKLRLCGRPLLGALLALCAVHPAVHSAPAVQEESAEISDEPIAEISDEPVGEEERANSVVTHGEQVAIFTSIHIAPNEVVHGEVVCIGCEAVIEGTVTRDIVVVMGSLKFSGTAEQNLITVLSRVDATEDSVVGRDFVNVLGELDDEGVAVGHQRFNLAPFGFLPSFEGAFGFALALAASWKILMVLLTFLTLLVLTVFVPDRNAWVAETTG